MNQNKAKFLKYKRRRNAEKIIRMIYGDKIRKINRIRIIGKTAHINLAIMIPATPELIDFSLSLMEAENENSVNHACG
jgi:hypothetical protein